MKDEAHAQEVSARFFEWFRFFAFPSSSYRTKVI